MQRFTLREMLVLASAAAAVTSLGISTHLEYRAMQTACLVAADLDERTELGPAQTTIEQVVLPSRTQAAVPEPASLPDLAYGPAFSFVVRADRPYLVLSTEVDPIWQRGELQTVGESRVRADVAADTLPDALARWHDRSVVLYGPQGAVGFGEVGAPELFADVEGELGVLVSDAYTEAYYEALEADRDPPPLPPAAIWESGRQLLVAPIETTATGEIWWARDAELPAPRVLVSAGPRDEATVDAAARLLTHAYATALGERLDGVAPHERVRVESWHDEAGRAWAQTAWFDGPEFGDCGLEATPIWTGVLLGGATATPLPFVTDERVTGPVVMADLDLDGHLDIVTAPDHWADAWAVYAGGPDGWTRVESMLDTPYHGCPC